MLPFLVVVLGVDNISIVTQAVSATSVELSLPERMGQGFARVGFPLFLTFLVEIAMAAGAFFLLPVGGGWREISGFASVALVTDYLLQASLFLTVLSIDMQRLELADLLRQGSGSQAMTRQRAMSLGRSQPSDTSSWTVMRRALRWAVESRLARTYTFTSVRCASIFLCSAWSYCSYSSSSSTSLSTYGTAQATCPLASAVSALLHLPSHRPLHQPSASGNSSAVARLPPSMSSSRGRLFSSSVRPTNLSAPFRAASSTQTAFISSAASSSLPSSSLAFSISSLPTSSRMLMCSRLRRLERLRNGRKRNRPQRSGRRVHER